jgi:pyridinium-3,5-bisthiocarboxylic acid mononucleotide nickel chelatase
MSVRGKHLHVDCASGAAGDMMLGALLDLGVPVDVVGDALDAIGAGRYRLRVTKVTKRGIAATDLKVDTGGSLTGDAPHVHAASPAAAHATGDHHAHVEGAELDDRDVLGHGRRMQRDTMLTPAFGHALQSDGRHHRDTALTPIVTESARSPSSPMRSSHGPAPAYSHAQSHSHDHSHLHNDPPSLDHDHAGGHVHEHSHDDGTGHSDSPGKDRSHSHHHYSAIRSRIAGAALTPGTKRRALDIFDRIARAEAAIHGTTVDAVAFHEVGAIDSVVDVVGTAAALDWLDPATVTCTGVAMGHGTITCAHGVLPVPAPAALEVLREARGVMMDGGLPRELCTPTGAAILAATVTSWTPAPAGTPLAIGWGAGDAELADRANVLRAVVIEPVGAPTDAVWQIDANLDDMSPELCGPAAEAVFAAGALDVWWTPITMKKGRPALTLSALAESGAREAVIAAILRETTTIGVRYGLRERTVLARRSVEVATRYGAIPIKLAMQGESVVNAAPEYEACAAAAKAHGVPVKLVFAAALAAYDTQR